MVKLNYCIPFTLKSFVIEIETFSTDINVNNELNRSEKYIIHIAQKATVLTLNKGSAYWDSNN